MLPTFVDKLSTFFDRRFIVAYWLPCLMGLGLISLGAAAVQGLLYQLNWLSRQQGTVQIILALAALLGVTFCAYLLEGISVPLLRFYEGYWPHWMKLLKVPAHRRQEKLFERSSSGQRYFSFPSKHRLLPTRFGNRLRAAEEYPLKQYQLDSVVWWPRLAPLFPEAFRSQMEAALIPIFTLLNLCTIFVILALLGGPALLYYHQPWWLVALVIGSATVFARMCYSTAVGQVTEYGNLIRVAFDLYRHEILKQMRIPLPTNLVEERILWKALNAWIYGFVPPWENGWPVDSSTIQQTFYYEVSQRADDAKNGAV